MRIKLKQELKCTDRSVTFIIQFNTMCYMMMSKGFYNVTILSCKTIVAEDCQLSFKETAEC